MSLFTFLKSSSKKYALKFLIISVFFLSFPSSLFAGAIVWDPGNYVPNYTSAFADGSIMAKEFGLDAIAWFAANTVIKRMAAQTVNWINSGFQGKPAYLRDSTQFFTDVGDDVAGKFLTETSLNNLCEPFKAQVRLALVQNYISDSSQSYACSLTTLKNNYDQFTQDFSAGGWDAWFELTQNDENNPYGAYLNAQRELSIRIGTERDRYEKQLSFGNGFLSYEVCPKGMTITASDQWYLERGYKVGDCADQKQIATPGKVIENQLNESLGGGRRRIEAADEIDEIISALLNQLMSWATGKVEGLFGASQTSETSGTSYTESLINETESNPTNPGDRIICTTVNDVTDCTPNIPEPPESPQVLPTIPPNYPQTTGVVICIPDADGVLTCSVNGTGGGGGQCADTGEQYAGALRTAMDNVLAANPSVASLPNTEAGGRPNARTFLALVETELIAMGYNSRDEVLNGNSNPSTGDIIAVWRDGDTYMERYDAIRGETNPVSTIANSTQTAFEGFIPLNCYSGGGGTDCGCRKTTSGTTTTIPNPSTGPLAPTISSITPTSVVSGSTVITINGTNLQNTSTGAVSVVFVDSLGRNTVSGRSGVNSTGTQTTVLVPAGLVGSSVTVYIDNGTGLVSNSVRLQLGTPINLPVASPTSVWQPTQTINGWWPRLSPDGRFVSYGNWGESWVTDLQTGTNYDFRSPPNVGANGTCISGYWITPTKLTFVCTSDAIPGNNMYRYEVDFTGGTPSTPVQTTDNVSLVAGNTFVARDGNWASWLALGFRLAKNNVAIGTSGGNISLSNNELVGSCDNSNAQLCVWNGASISRRYSPRVPPFNTATTDSYIMYGGYGPVRGITPTGTDVDLRLSSNVIEGVGKIITVNGEYWAVTSAFSSAGEGYIFLRPWGSRSAVVVQAGASSLDVVVSGTNFIIAYNNDRGGLQVLTVPINSTRTTVP